MLSWLRKTGKYDFLSNINVNGIDKITFTAVDDYDNEKVVNYAIKRTEINPPKVYYCCTLYI